MNKTHLMAVTGLFAVLGSSAQAAFFFDEASFLAAVDAPYYEENFDGWSFGNPLNGTQNSWSAPGANGYGWDASAPQGLYSNVSSLSTNFSNEAITITFTGAPVTAFGAYLGNTDITGAFITGSVTMDVGGGNTTTVNVGAAETFVGWVDLGTPLTSVSIIAAGQTNNWIQADGVITGSAVPEPGTMAALALGLAAIARKRRNK